MTSFPREIRKNGNSHWWIHATTSPYPYQNYSYNLPRIHPPIEIGGLLVDQ
ncbi:MAG: hypothetical protein ACXAEU_12900 [Candidatus Hodarchaeales archaeon]